MKPFLDVGPAWGTAYKAYKYWRISQGRNTVGQGSAAFAKELNKLNKLAADATY